MYERTYTGVSLLATEYFRALVAVVFLQSNHHIHTGYDIVPDDDGYTFQTYTITVRSRETYDLMQKVFTAENG